MLLRPRAKSPNIDKQRALFNVCPKEKRHRKTRHSQNRQTNNTKE